MVDELINPIDHTWDEDLIRSIFWPTDVYRILQIPITPGRDDVVAWHYNRSGIFSVRSAYHCQWEEKFSNRNVQSLNGNVSERKLWKRLWQLKVPSKVKIFGWRALKGFLPCMAILANRHISETGGCPVCRLGAEDIKHLFFTCEKMKAVWRWLGQEQKVQQLASTERSGSVILEEIIRAKDQIQALDVGFAELVLTVGWYNWWERRQLVHGERVQNCSRSAMAMVAITKNYKAAGKKTAKLRQGWKKPPDGTVMVNVDAGFNENGGSGNVGAVIRDSSGSFLAACHSFIMHLVDAQMAEAYALKEGLMLAQRIGCNKLIIQSDCMEVVQIMQEGGFSTNSAAPIYDECNTLWCGFQEIAIEHCNRDTNQVAHSLAQQAGLVRQSCIWDDDPPSCILGALANDVTL